MRKRSLAAGLAMLFASAGNADPVGEVDYRAVRAAWAEARTLARSDAVSALLRYDALIQAEPGNNGMLLSAIGVAARAEDRVRLARWLLLFVEQGGALEADDRKAITQLLGDRAATTLALAEMNGKPLGESADAATLPAELPLIEGVAYDARSGAIFVSNVMGRTIERVDGKGERGLLTQLAERDGFPMALTFDAGRGVLWAAVDSAPFPSKAPGAGGLLRVNAKDGSGALIGAESGVVLHIGDVALATDGTAYAADSQSGAIYRCPPGCSQLTQLVPAGRLRSAQGMAVSGGRLWVADYSYGLLAVNLRNGGIERVRPGAGMALDGIDGLALRNGRLIAVQNGWAPARVIEIALDHAATKAIGIRILARGGRTAQEPGQFALARGGQILLVANSQWARMGKPDGARPPADPTRIAWLEP